jgi:hypothetical protein
MSAFCSPASLASAGICTSPEPAAVGRGKGWRCVWVGGGEDLIKDLELRPRLV